MHSIECSEVNMRARIGKYSIELNARARWPFKHFKVHKGEASTHVVWGKLSLVIDDMKAEVYKVCSQCGSTEIGEVRFGDEGLTVCRSCCSVEQGYDYISLEEYERLNH
jgi:hypothetical protein